MNVFKDVEKRPTDMKELPQCPKLGFELTFLACSIVTRGKH